MQVVDLQEVIRGCLQGDQDTWRVLFDGHASVVFHVFRGFGASRETAEDIVGDVFLQLIEDRGRCLSRARFTDERQLCRWLIVLAKHRFLDAYRHERAARAVKVEEPTEDELAATTTAVQDPTEQLLDHVVTRTEVERIMAVVSPRERLLVKLFYFEELKIREIADLTGAPLGAVSGAITRAREKMRRAMQQNDGVTRSMNRGEKPGWAPAGHGDAAEETP